MNRIAVDIGNSAAKFLVGKKDWRLDYGDEQFDENFRKLRSTCSADEAVVWVVVSVNQNRCDQLKLLVEQTFPQDRFLVVSNEDVPLKSQVKNRELLGTDRLVAAFAASHRHAPPVPVIVIDAGTAVTIDVVTIDQIGQPVFAGGLIFPGAQASAKALHGSTDQLPDISDMDFDGGSQLIGDDTQSSIERGVVLAQAHAVLGIVEALGRVQGNTVVHATGGGMESIVSALPAAATEAWIIEPGLVLSGVACLGVEDRRP